MNTPPDDNTLALWLDDELEGEELARVDAWAADHPDQLVAREQIRDWRKMIGDNLSDTEEPPAPQFFNERILHAIQQSDHAEPIHQAASTSNNRRGSWNSWWMPAAACAGMVLAFLLGGMNQPQSLDPTASNTPHLYTPEKGVNAQWISSEDASATVIVLNGVSAIPDDVDFSAVAIHRTRREIDSTASSASPTLKE